MTDSIDNEFNKTTHAIEETKGQIRGNAEPEYDQPHLTLEMDSDLGQEVRQGVFEGKQAKLWMENKQEPPPTQSEKPLDQEFKQKAFKPLRASFFDNLSNEDRAKIEAYRQANPESSKEKQSQKTKLSY